jgi:hypothetical protein
MSDMDPFYGLQIQAPGFPCILLPIPALRKKKIQDAIFNLLPLLTNFWKVDSSESSPESSPKPKKRAKRRNSDSDSDSDNGNERYRYLH